MSGLDDRFGVASVTRITALPCLGRVSALIKHADRRCIGWRVNLAVPDFLISEYPAELVAVDDPAVDPKR